MTFQQIRCIVEIARCGSISKASSNLYITQPYLSNLLKELEYEVRIQIFQRASKGVTLTDAGKEFISYVQPLLEQHDNIIHMYTQAHVEPAMRINISMQRFPFVTKSFIEFYNEMLPDRFEFHIREEGMYHVINDVSEKRSDIGFLYISKTPEAFITRTLAAKSLSFHLISNITPRIFFHKHHPMAHQDSIPLDDMQAYPFVVFEEESYVPLDYSEEVVLYGSNSTQKRFFIRDRATMINILSNTDAFSVGSGILPYGFAGSELTSRPIAGYHSDTKIGYIMPKGIPVSEPLEEIIRRTKANIESAPRR